MSAASTLYISGCKDHPGTTDLSCCRIRRADGTALDIREVWAVIQKMEEARAELEEQRRELLDACKSALAALSQPMTYPADIELAKARMSCAIASVEATQ